MTGGSLTPLLDPLPAAFLASEPVVRALVREHGSPLNVVFPAVFEDNVAAFRDVLGGVSHRIFYAHKANQSRAFVAAALRCGIDIDVASAGELGQALSAGFPADRIEATGPKGACFLSCLAGQPGLTVNVDNLWELSTLASTASAPLPVLLRLSGGRRLSRFGMAPWDFDAAFTLLARSPLVLRGISFHLDTADVLEKAEAVRVALGLVEKAYGHGLSPAVLNIGGGFRQRYLADPEGFDAYVHSLRDGLAGKGPSLAWGGQTFGYRVTADGSVQGTPVFHRYTGTVSGPSTLAALLSASVDGQTVSSLLNDMMLSLWIEPGKALVDHAGLTIATVQFVKRAADGSLLVNLDISRDDVTPADQEVMLDPVLLGPSGSPCDVFLAGNLCLERDMISNHLVRLPRLPEPGDLLVFANTAAYQMDLSASEALMHPRLRKIAVERHGDAFSWVRDGGSPCSISTSPT